MSVWTGATPGSPSWEPPSLQLRSGLTSEGGTRGDTRRARGACREGGREATMTEAGVAGATAGATGVVASPGLAGRLSRWERILSVISTR